MSDRPKPFPDVVDRRSGRQRRADRPTAEAQSAALLREIARSKGTAARTTGTAETPDMFGVLNGRRANQFDVVATNRGGRTAFVRDQVLTRRGPASPIGIAGPDLPGGQFDEDRQLEIDCPLLAARLIRYNATAVDAQQRAADISGVAGSAERAGVAVLHVVIKSPGGPAPAEVAPPNVPLSLAGGQPVQVAVIDTGITAEQRTDGWLSNVDHTREVDPLDEFPKPVPDDRLDLGAGHGTFVAGIIQQIDPLADIRIYRAMDSDGLGEEIAVACAMIRAVEDGAEVVNLSVGNNTVDGQPSLVYEAALDVIDTLRPGGDRPVIVAAAGNSGDDEPVWPAASERVIAVAALGTDGAGAPWSSRGSWVDVSTIGQGIVSTFVAGTEVDQDTNGDGVVDVLGDTFELNAWAIWSGTSFACAQISGAVARKRRETGLTPQAAADQLIASGSVVDADFGRGLEILPGT